MRRFPLLFLAALVGVVPLLILAVFLRAGQPAGADRTLLPYAKRNDSVRLADGRSIHLVCEGQGSPVVVLTAGGGSWSIDWNKVQPAVAAKTRVCAWDRAGFGLSTPTSSPQTVADTTTDLQAALKAGRVAGPYVAVGQSLGGYESVLLKDRERSDVVGMVLVDPSFPDQYARFALVAPNMAGFWRPARPDALLMACAATLHSRVFRYGGPELSRCLHPEWPQSYPAELRVALENGPAEATPELIASSVDTLVAYQSPPLLERDSKIVIKPDRNYGDMPLIVLTLDDHQPPTSPPYLSAAAKAEVPGFVAEWRRGHDAYAALSTRGVSRVVPNSTHNMQQSNPQAVIDAIDEVVDEARNPRSAEAAP